MMRKRTFSLALSIFLVGISTVSFTFAWFTWFKIFGDTDVEVGVLDPAFELKIWDKEEANWKLITEPELTVASLGYMKDITSLPADANFYMQIHLKDVNITTTTYHILLNEITIEVNDEFGDSILEILNTESETLVDYYMNDGSQLIFEFAYQLETTGVIDPTTLFDSTPNEDFIHINSRDMSLTDGIEVSPSTWLYVMARPRLVEVQNVVTKVPIIYSPYDLVFYFELEGVITTDD